MGIEYRITTEGFQRTRLDMLIDTMLAGIGAYANRQSAGPMEIRFDHRNELPDAMISYTEDALIFTFNSGHRQNRTVFGALITSMTNELQSVSVEAT